MLATVARIFSSLTAVGLIAAFFVYQHFDAWSEAATAMSEDTIVTFAPGSSVSTLIHELQDLNVLDGKLDALYFRLLSRSMDVSGRLQAGEYRIAADASPRTILSMLARGQVVTYDVVIVAGTTTRELLLQLQNDERLTPWADHPQTADLQTLLNLQLPFVEGVFLPETYQVRRGDKVQTILQRAHDDLMGALQASWAQRTFVSPIADPAELLILASIIEKETGQDADRTHISQVFHLRLQKKMRLQTDPTVIYAIGEKFDGDIKRGDLRIDSPYNTYRHAGLPPTPIALPSRRALETAAQPAQGDFLYFVARGDGSSQFSRTLEEHNSAVARYQLRRR